MQTILIVEDYTDAVIFFQELLEERGYATHTAATGAAAKAFLATAKPDVVLLDIGLPDMDGQEVVPFIDADTKIIVMSAITSSSLSKIVDDMKPFRALRKPFELAELIEAIEAAMESRRRWTSK